MHTTRKRHDREYNTGQRDATQVDFTDNFTDNFTDPLLTPIAQTLLPRKDAQEQVFQQKGVSIRQYGVNGSPRCF